MMNNVSLTFDPDKVEIDVTAVEKVLGRFTAISPLTNKSRLDTRRMDLFDILASQPNPPNFILALKYLKDSLGHENNFCNIQYKSIPKAQHRKIRDGIKVLKQMDLIRPILKNFNATLGIDKNWIPKPYSFLLNPFTISSGNAKNLGIVKSIWQTLPVYK